MGMRRKGTSAQLAVIRQRGLALLNQGKKAREVAELLNVTTRSVQRLFPIPDGKQGWQQPRRKSVPAYLVS
jgi:hypothetical protein